MSKLQSLAEIVKQIPNGSTLALGGNALHRSPAKFVEELVRQGKKELSLIKTAGAYDVDLLALAGALREVHGGYIGFEMLGLAPHYRKGVEQKTIVASEHACASVIAGLRAAAYGVPFLPINGFKGSQLPKVRGWKRIDNPYNQSKEKEEVLLIPSLNPDFAILHVHLADTQGNAFIEGPEFEDLLMIRAAKRVFLTAEEVISPSQWEERIGQRNPQISGFLVESVAQVANGAAPGSLPKVYAIDEEKVVSYLQDGQAWLNEIERGVHA